MFTSDKNILKLIQLLKFQKVIKSDKQFDESINTIAGTVSKVSKGKTHFTVTHIETICERYNVNANFIFGFDEVVFRDKSKKKISEFSFSFNDLSDI